MTALFASSPHLSKMWKLHLSLSFFFLFSSISLYVPLSNGAQPIVKTITVDHKGHGDFSTVQAAIDSVPKKNNQWIKIHVKAGVYMEKVNLPGYKGFILLEGDGPRETFIEWGDHHPSAETFSYGHFTSTWDTATFITQGNNVILSRITFKNTYHSSSDVDVAVAAIIAGEKTSIYNCSFIGIQDTLSDLVGHHYYKDCYIEGAIDFIFGFAQSIYEGCTMSIVATGKGDGWVTAQGRNNDSDSSGFVFKSCNVIGSAKTYLGRAWRTFARVVFYKTYMADIVVPDGWVEWQAQYGGNFTTFAESDCFGPGSNTSGRVKWEKKLSDADLTKLTSLSFVNYDGWLDLQPNGYGYS